jgi:hypothetical protein
VRLTPRNIVLAVLGALLHGFMFVPLSAYMLVSGYVQVQCATA